MRRLLAVPAAALAFVLGSALAEDEAAPSAEIVKELRSRQAMLVKDLEKIEQAAKDVREMRETRDAGIYTLNAEEKKLERSARMDLHIFMERARNDTLETLALLDRVLKTQDYVDPLERVFGAQALKDVVAVRWDSEDLDTVIGELSAAYRVRINIGGEIDYRKQLSLTGEMSVLSILLYLESLYEAKLVFRDGELWFVRVGGKKDE